MSTILPDVGYITEENIASYSGEDFYWIVDPLDGTTNFMHDKSPYAVSIALGSIAEGMLVGVVYDVCRDECFYAWKNGGAYLNGVSIRASEGGLSHLRMFTWGCPMMQSATVPRWFRF